MYDLFKKIERFHFLTPKNLSEVLKADRFAFMWDFILDVNNNNGLVVWDIF